MKLLGHALSSLFGFGNGWNGDNAHYTLRNYLFILIVAVVACSPIIPRIASRLSASAQRKDFAGGVAKAVMQVAAVVIPVALLALSALALVGDNYNPFLYFRF